MPSLPLIVLVLASFGSASFGPASLGAQADRVAAWTEDVLHLVEEIERLHPDPFFGTPRAEFEAAIDAFIGGLEERSDEEAIVELMRLVALLAREGRDGHSMVWSSDFEFLPLQLYRFEDGWFVVGTSDAHGDLVGRKVTAIGATPVDALATRLAPLLTRDNEWNLLAKLPMALVTPALTGGRMEDGTVHVRVEAADGKASDVTFAPAGGGFPAHALPPRGTLVSARGHERSWWSEPMPAERALYVQYNAVLAGDAAGTLAQFAATLAPALEEHALERLVLDVRWNGGGDNTTFGPLIEALKDPRIDRPGRLFALIGRHTFSAAGNFVTVLDRDTGALLVGEPTGGAPNQYGDARDVPLPGHPSVLVRIVTRYHAFGGPDDRRLTHEPDLRVPVRAAEYFAGEDPVLARALVHEPK